MRAWCANGGQTKKYRFLGLESRTGLEYVDVPVVVVAAVVVVVMCVVLQPKYKWILQKVKFWLNF